MYQAVLVVEVIIMIVIYVQSREENESPAVFAVRFSFFFRIKK